MMGTTEHRDAGRRERDDESRAPGPRAATPDGGPAPADPTTFRRDGPGGHPPDRAIDVAGVRQCETDRLLLHVAERLRSSGADLPDARLLQLAEELFADVARVVLAWAEDPSPGIARRPAA